MKIFFGPLSAEGFTSDWWSLKGEQIRIIFPEKRIFMSAIFFTRCREWLRRKVTLFMHGLNWCMASQWNNAGEQFGGLSYSKGILLKFCTFTTVRVNSKGYKKNENNKRHVKFPQNYSRIFNFCNEPSSLHEHYYFIVYMGKIFTSREFFNLQNVETC